jgi:hypothetical protein
MKRHLARVLSVSACPATTSVAVRTILDKPLPVQAATYGNPDTV